MNMCVCCSAKNEEFWLKFYQFKIDYNSFEEQNKFTLGFFQQIYVGL